VCRQRRQTVRAGRMFGGKVTLVTFSTVYEDSTRCPLFVKLFQKLY